MSSIRHNWLLAASCLVLVGAVGGLIAGPKSAGSAPQARAVAAPAVSLNVSTEKGFRVASVSRAPVAAPVSDAPLPAAVSMAVDHPVAEGKVARLAEPLRVEAPAAAEATDHFDAFVKRADVTPAKMALAIAEAKAKRAARAGPKITLVTLEPVSERFSPPAGAVAAAGPVLMAYADPAPTAVNHAISAVAALATAPEALNPDVDGLPDAGPLPNYRPKIDQAVREMLPEKPAKKDDAPKLAYAKPDIPAGEKSGGGLGNGLKNLFGRPRAGNGVAVYDISAARVYMPDGSVLEAHSGIGKMADNPRYVHVKMNGPTPPHTYNLKMREKRFHGVEAIRMLPVDGKNKHGRDGFLTHSYLLRGGRAESHGCVAFKDYKKFLAAFKAGKVKQLVVVPGGGKDTLLAKNGQGA